MRFRCSPVATAAMALTIFGFTAATAPQASAQLRSCVDTLAGMPDFSRFVNGIVRTSVAGSMRNAHEITIFAPTNAALNHMNAMLLDRLFPMQDGGRQADPILAPAAIGAHVVSGRLDTTALAAAGTLTSVAGTPITVTGTMVKGADGVEATITQPNIACSNGLIQGIDAPLIR